MKYRVVGCTSADKYDICEENDSFAARHAIVDEIKKKGYSFLGLSHQEEPYCVPVLNDG